MATEPDLTFIARQNERILSEMAGFREEMRVQTAMIMRHDVSHSALLEELRAIHAQISRMNDRIRRLEDAS